MDQDINALKLKLKTIREELINSLPDMALENTITAKALVERNIRDIGFGAKYSGRKLPAWFFLEKAKSKAGEAYVEAKIKKDNAGTKTVDGKKIYPDDYGMTWADLRQAEGLPTDHVDLSFTNKTWAGIGPLPPYYNAGIIICPLGGSTKEVVDKLNWNRERYGDFFGKVLKKKELEILSAGVYDRVRIIFKNNGL